MTATVSLGGEPIAIDRMAIPIHNIEPNPDQPRAPEDREDFELLYESIKENRGIAQALLVEKIAGDKVRILDGERRWRACKKLLKEVPDSKAYAYTLPCDVVVQELTKEQRYRIWIFIHRNRKEWSGLVKEKTVIDLVDLVGRAKAADILGTDIKEVDEIIYAYRLAQRMTGSVKERAISYARAIMALPKKYQSRDIVDLLVDKTNSGVIRNNVEIREVKKILANEGARKEFFRPKTTIASALGTVGREKAGPTSSSPKVPEGPPEASALPEWLREVRTEAETFQVTDFLALKDNRKLLEEIKAEFQSVIDILSFIRDSLPRDG